MRQLPTLCLGADSTVKSHDPQHLPEVGFAIAERLQRTAFPIRRNTLLAVTIRPFSRLTPYLDRSRVTARISGPFSTRAESRRGPSNTQRRSWRRGVRSWARVVRLGAQLPFLVPQHPGAGRRILSAVRVTLAALVLNVTFALGDLVGRHLP